MYILTIFIVISSLLKQVDARDRPPGADILEVSLHHIPSSSANLRSSLSNHPSDNASKPAALLLDRNVTAARVLVDHAMKSSKDAKDAAAAIVTTDPFKFKLASTFTSISDMALLCLCVDPSGNIFGFNLHESPSIYKFGKMRLLVSYHCRISRF
jgi:hypothetical protein